MVFNCERFRPLALGSPQIRHVVSTVAGTVAQHYRCSLKRGAP